MQSTIHPQKYLARTITACQQYHNKAIHLFKQKDAPEVSIKHLARNIIINPKEIFPLIQSPFLTQLKSKNLQQYYEFKTQILLYVKLLIQDFPLNAKFIYEESFWLAEDNRAISLVTYIVKDLSEALLWQQTSQEAQHQQIFQKYQGAATAIFYQICSVCTLRTSQLKLITNTLTDFYYENKLSTQMIAQCLRLLDAGLQERSITPYLYFIDNNKNDSVKVLFSNNKWPFRKGMTIFLWINMLKQTECRIFWIKAQNNNELIVKVQAGKLIIESVKSKTQKQAAQICTFPINSIVMLGIQLVPCNQGVFKSANYVLNVNLNGSLFENVASKIPKFETNQFITEFSLLSSFIGNFYSLIVTTCAQLSKFQEISKMSQYGICKQSLVWQLIDRKVIKVDSIICIFNPERTFQGLLINYVSQRNHACYEGRISEIKYHKNLFAFPLYDEQIQVDTGLIKNKAEDWCNLFDLILQHIVQLISRQSLQIDSILFILYFIEMNEYNISQSTLKCLIEYGKDQNNFFLNLVIKYLDVHTLIQKGLVLDQQHEPYEDPVQKSILMFHLQTKWYEKWNCLQGFQGWWSPHFFKYQNDHPFNQKSFQFDPKKQNRVEWSVMNLITKDYCKCFVEPVFLLPQYAVFNRFQQDYVKKQCFLEAFKLNLYPRHPDKRQVLVYKKVSNSNFYKIKQKLLGTPEVQNHKKKSQPTDIKQFSTECLFMDVLSIVEGSIRTTKDGYIIFVSKHKGKSFDHMCTKAFKNQVFLYIIVRLTDIRKIYKKRFNASQNGVYIKTKDGRQIMLYFYLKDTDNFLSILQNHVKIQKDSCLSYIHSHEPFQWIDKRISNYQYLQWLNEIAGRCYNDITQYPVLPWIYIAEKEIQTGSQAKRYRDLSKNMGCQGDEQRIKRFIEKFNAKNQQELFSEYHFGTHYCSSAIIFNFLIRIRPFSIGAISLQSGQFDCADRIFYSYSGSWNNAISSPTDLRELIPELYTLPEIYINKNNYDYGVTQQKIVVDNVILPQWAQKNPYRFVAKLRRQLQSKFVSDNINNWIDLIYGFKQRGKDAIEHMNIFYPLSYQYCIDLDKVKQSDQRMSFQTQIAHFGQTPTQIIGNNPHPSRKKIKSQWQDKLISDGAQMTIQKCFLSKVSVKQQKFIFKSKFEGKNAILSIKFISDQMFLVLRKHEYYIFKIVSRRQNFLEKQQQEMYQLQSCISSLNYKELSAFVPLTVINQQIIIVGGFFNGNAHIIFLSEPKYNKSFKFPSSTITALVYQKRFESLLIGDEDGYLRAYRVSINYKQLQFQHLKLIKAHDSKVNNIVVNQKSNLICTCSKDGTLNLYNLYSLDIIRTICHPSYLPIQYAEITTSPLYALVFYSKQDSIIYVYSINGQFLDSFCQKTGYIYNISILKGSDSTQSLVYLNALRQLLVWQLPFLKLKRKIKVKKDEHRVTCFQASSNGKLAIAGSDGGAMQLITNLSCYSQ